MASDGALSLDRLIARDPLSVFEDGYHLVLIGVFLYVLGSIIGLIHSFIGGSDIESLLCLFSGAVMLWLYPIFVIIGFLFISVGLIVYMNELSEKGYKKISQGSEKQVIKVAKDPFADAPEFDPLENGTTVIKDGV